MSTEIEIVGYLRASPEGKPEWSEDCVCVDAVYPNYDGDESVSMPICRLADAKAINDQLRAELAAIKAGQGEAVAEVSAETFSSDGTSDIITRNLPIGTALYTAPPDTGDAVSVPAAMPERWEDRLSRMHQTIQAGCWPKRWVDDAKDYELGELRALLTQSNGVKP